MKSSCSARGLSACQPKPATNHSPLPLCNPSSPLFMFLIQLNVHKAVSLYCTWFHSLPFFFFFFYYSHKEERYLAQFALVYLDDTKHIHLKQVGQRPTRSRRWRCICSSRVRFSNFKCWLSQQPFLRLFRCYMIWEMIYIKGHTHKK